MAKTSETDLGLAVMRFLATRSNGQATMRTVIKRLAEYIALTPEDHEPSGVRHGEEMWEQRVRNLKSHDKTEGNILAEGFVERPARGHYRLTQAGYSRLTHHK
jgi:restriction endonuclease Mrr